VDLLRRSCRHNLIATASRSAYDMARNRRIHTTCHADGSRDPCVFLVFRRMARLHAISHLHSFCARNNPRPSLTKLHAFMSDIEMLQQLRNRAQIGFISNHRRKARNQLLSQSRGASRSRAAPPYLELPATHSQPSKTLSFPWNSAIILTPDFAANQSRVG